MTRRKQTARAAALNTANPHLGGATVTRRRVRWGVTLTWQDGLGNIHHLSAHPRGRRVPETVACRECEVAGQSPCPGAWATWQFLKQEFSDDGSQR